MIFDDDKRLFAIRGNHKKSPHHDFVSYDND